MVDTVNQARPRLTGSNARKTRAEEDALLALKQQRYSTRPAAGGDTKPVAGTNRTQPADEPMWNPPRNDNPNYQGFMGIVNMVQDALAGNYNKKGIRGEKPR